VLTGETGAGKSILIDALQLVLGARADAGVVREGAARADLCAEFDLTPRCALAGRGRLEGDEQPAAAPHGRRPGQEPRLDQRHAGHRHPAAPAGRAAARHPRPARLAKPDPARAVRSLLDAYAGSTRGLQQLAAVAQALGAGARARRPGPLLRERERLTWQIGELDKLARRR
jgi:DNA repair protein RecN (Recombination protein N)